MTRDSKTTLALIALLLLGLPLAFILTILLVPFWSYLENATGIEAVGHSGPAGWCFVLVYGAMLIACVIGVRRAVRKAME